ncbi:MAG: DUF924 family protein [Xanthobacteraceae bacterium]
MHPSDILQFWRTGGEQKWFTRDDAFDAEIRRQFLPAYERATSGHLDDLEVTPDGALALLILLDQMPRNMFRGTARAYATDPLARAVAQRALARGFDRSFPPPERQFFYLPFMHSEALADQERSVELYRDAGDADGLKYAEQHAAIIRRFGRFPHRNPLLGRPTTAEEQAFLDAGGFSG